MLPTSHDLLAAVADDLDSSAAAGNFHMPVIRAAGHASVVLGFSELAERFSRILTRVPEDEFFAGTIMNITPDAKAFRRLRRLDDRDVVEREIPPFRSSDVEELARSQEATSLAWERQYELALAAALARPRQPPETSMVAELAATAAVVGDFDIAQQLLREDNLPARDAYAVRIVLTIEYVRVQRYFEAEHVLTGLRPPVQDWWSIQLALGLAGRRPWNGYPYADY